MPSSKTFFFEENVKIFCRSTVLAKRPLAQARNFLRKERPARLLFALQFVPLMTPEYITVQ
jgi:hypothetical protein